MKRLLFLFILISISTQSCEDNFLTDDIGSSMTADTYYDTFGEKLSQVFSIIVKDEEFKGILINQLKKEPLGDTEILLSDFLVSVNKGQSVDLKSRIIEQAIGLFTEEELDNFIAAYPSLLIAGRGPLTHWESSSMSPAVVFVPSTFNENQKSIGAVRSKTYEDLDISKNFNETVIVFHLSERHDRMGTPYNQTLAGKGRKGRGQKDGIAINGGNQLPTCFPAGYCQQVEVNDFKVELQNTGIYVSYDIEQTNNICGEWLRIDVKRTNPNGLSTTTTRDGNDLPGYYDSNITPGVRYEYILTAYHIIPGNGDETTLCLPATTTDPITIVSPQISSSVEFFRGENLSNKKLFYTWQPPSQGVNEYELRRWQDDSWQQVAVLPGNQTYFGYEYPESDRGESVFMSIRNRASGPWSSYIFDETKGSFRNPGSNLYFYGMEFANTYEINETVIESPLFGRPELRVIAYRGVSPESGDIIEEVVVPTKRCSSINTGTYSTMIDNPADDRYGEFVEIEYQILTNYYVPIDGAIEIISNWNSELHGQYIKMEVSETDVMEITADVEIFTESNSKSFSAKVGTKIFGIGPLNPDLGLGFNIETKTKETRKVYYPNSDALIGTCEYTYYAPIEQEINGMFFGPNYAVDLCCRLKDFDPDVQCE